MNGNSLMNFVFEESLVRVHVDENGNPWFCARDVCRILELDNVTEATRALDEDEKGLFRITEGTSPEGGNPNLLFVSESGLYALVFRSRKPEARRIRKWVTAEVLPALRRTGSYALPCRESVLPEGDPARDVLDSLPDEVRRLTPETRERFLAAAQRTAQMCGISDKNTLHSLFVEYCLKLGCNPVSPSFTVSAHSRAALRLFVADHCERINPNLRTPLDSIYEAYCDWCMDQGGDIEAISLRAFMDRLPSATPWCELAYPSERGVRRWYVKGLGFGPDSAYRTF
jgi:prophage antirepressor-like protein